MVSIVFRPFRDIYITISTFTFVCPYGSVRHWRTIPSHFTIPAKSDHKMTLVEVALYALRMTNKYALIKKGRAELRTLY